MTTAKNSKLERLINPRTQNTHERFQANQYRCESVYLLSNSQNRRSSPKEPSKKRGQCSNTCLIRAPNSDGPTWRQLRKDQSDKDNSDHYILITEDYTQPAMQLNPCLDAVFCDILSSSRQQQLQMSGLATPSIRGTRLSICVEHTRFPLVGRISKSMGFQHVPEHRLWNVQWCDASPHIDLFKAMKRFQQINHFPGMSEICRKDMLSRNLNRMLKMYPGDYRIFPKTWLLPTDVYDVALYASKHRRTFILKPYSAGQGRGIWLTNDLSTVGKREKLICQTYIEKPLLIDGYKFDLRVYTLVTSVDPLRIFVYNEGLARFATNKYVAPTLGNSDNLFMHLTNYCLNRRNSQYEIGRGDDCGSKRKLSGFNKWLREHNYDVDEFWASVDDAIIKTVISAWPVLRHNYHACFPRHDKIQASFQLLGFDILVDWKLKPYILEVNHAPSLAADETVDHDVKRPLIRDTLNLLATVLVDKEQIIREDRAEMRKRLMRQVCNRRNRIPTLPATKEQNQKHEVKQACSMGSLAQQIAWEESHLGNYRRVMPPSDSDKANYYCKFYDQTKQIVMFADTAASRQREQLTRIQIEKHKLQQQQEQRQQNPIAPQRRVAEQHSRPSAKQQTELLTKRGLDWIEKKLARMKPMLVGARTLSKANEELRQSLLEQEEQARKKRKLICKQAFIAKQIMEQKQQLLLRDGSKERLGIWQTLQRQSDVVTPQRKPTKGRKGRHGRRKSRRQHLLDLDAQGDVLFMKTHAIKPPATPVYSNAKNSDTKLIKRLNKSEREETALVVSRKTRRAKSTCSRQDVEKQRTKNVIKRSRSQTMTAPKYETLKGSSSLYSSSTTQSIHSRTPKRRKRLRRTQSSQEANWQPVPIIESDEKKQLQWRMERSIELEGWQIRKLFNQMYQAGHLSKNDIRKFPNLLYNILKKKVATNTCRAPINLSQ
ncbi:tubulin polyglutamylase TTLL13 isoform X2 [Scaptodrosophila lebanonensis]|uniref:Tubulin polyglutamylase TTLL13 isoform X2 n=1 Tax=Drosophila lebanonensis TaxID=7225 RepID=A0A6J2UJ83_DROLE|nr:tubulin polyglutamylase TTLL13 isoform X2 [Scaptodrosophila lebanonensis]